jgi:hypothetical protein
MHQSPAGGSPSPSLNTKGSRSERSEESEDPPKADRSSTRVRIAQRDGDAGETARAPGTTKRPAIRRSPGASWSRRESNPHGFSLLESQICILPQGLQAAPSAEVWGRVWVGDRHFPIRATCVASLPPGLAVSDQSRALPCLNLAVYAWRAVGEPPAGKPRSQRETADHVHLTWCIRRPQSRAECR